MSPVFLLSGILMIGSGLGFIYYWRYKTHVPWGFFGLGILGWIIAVFLKGIAALSLPPFKNFLYSSLTTGVADPILWIYDCVCSACHCWALWLHQVKEGIFRI